MSRPFLIIHGGAGKIPPDRLEATRAGIGRALEAGWSVLSTGGTALDAVETAIVVLEDDPVFNAGTGAHLNFEGRVQLDAILMDGRSLKAGAVAAVERIRNPIRLARCVQARSPHMMLVAGGAEKFAAENGFPLCDPGELVVEEARMAWKKALEDPAREGPEQKLGTVGAVAVDGSRSIAAGTSTGGTFSKYPGRVGDSPLIGCGCYADVDSGGVSCTGQGEAIMKIVMAKTAVDLLRDPHALAQYRQTTEPGGGDAPKTGRATIAQAVADAVVRKLAHRARGTGGLILLDCDGHPAAAYNAPGMSYGYVDLDGSFRIFP